MNTFPVPGFQITFENQHQILVVRQNILVARHHKYKSIRQQFWLLSWAIWGNLLVARQEHLVAPGNRLCVTLLSSKFKFIYFLTAGSSSLDDLVKSQYCIGQLKGDLLKNTLLDKCSSRRTIGR